MISDLSFDDIGRFVINTKKGKKGIIKSFLGQFVWIVYEDDCDGDWDNFMNYFGRSANANDLIFK